ncbi:expansin family protein [Artomyces pyxidatus]|uniref:Expansin family protein n=1 Tax=Artomyces pyxidatus TaxID=48021 RepID=A0ACB8T0I3_9AGAM|nr:expansin family protein [Artomyces pyxidatus]
MYHFIAMLFTLITLLASTIAAPVPNNSTIVDLDKRATHDGRGTWFYPGLGACGGTNSNNDHIVAMSQSFYDTNGGGNCWQYVHIKNEANGKSVYAQMVDSCPGCSYYDLDMSPSAFEAIGSLSTGVLSISWSFMEKGFEP